MTAHIMHIKIATLEERGYEIENVRMVRPATGRVATVSRGGRVEWSCPSNKIAEAAQEAGVSSALDGVFDSLSTALTEQDRKISRDVVEAKEVWLAEWLERRRIVISEITTRFRILEHAGVHVYESTTLLLIDDVLVSTLYVVCDGNTVTFSKVDVA